LALSGACDVTPGSFSWPATLQPFALVASPRLGLQQLSFKLPFTLSLLAFAFGFPLLPFCLKHFFLTSFSSQVEEKNKKKKTIEKKKKGKSFLSSSYSASHFCLHFYPFVSNFFSWHLNLFKQKRKKQKEKKTIEKKKMQRRKEASKLPLDPLTFGFRFYPRVSTLLLQTLSDGIFSFSSKRKEKKNKGKKP
jgi:hypothetical protein